MCAVARRGNADGEGGEMMDLGWRDKPRDSSTSAFSLSWWERTSASLASIQSLAQARQV